MRRAFPFRTRILAVVLAGGVIPLLVVGLWLNRRASHLGEEVLRRRLDSALDRAVQEVGASWIQERAVLVTYSESPGFWRKGEPMPDPAPSQVVRVTAIDSGGERAIALPPVAEAGAIFHLRMPAYDRATGGVRGTLALELRADGLLAGLPAAGATVGALVAAFDQTGASLLAVPMDPALLAESRFQWGGEEWIVARRVLEEPPLSLLATAPITTFTKPFEQAARSGTVVLAVVALASLLLAALLTAGFTQRLGRLATAADAIAKGDLDRRIEPGAPDEVGRVARAFNTMTDSLRRTFAELAQRESLAAVGQFASALAHEIRNPLTAIRLDLQRVEETLDTSSPAHATQRRALREVDRLESTVSGALRIARSGRITMARIDLLDPLRAAVDAAVPEFLARDAHLDPLPAVPGTAPVLGDASALEQVFLNLLLNAAHALEPGGKAWVEVGTDAENVIVVIRDQGCGIPAESLAKVFELFYSTRAGGTGLGLAIARNIVLAHGGAIDIGSEPGHGTSVRVTLPVATGGGAPV